MVPLSVIKMVENIRKNPIVINGTLMKRYSFLNFDVSISSPPLDNLVIHSYLSIIKININLNFRTIITHKLLFNEIF